MLAIVQVCAKFGLESEEFKKVFDLHTTQLGLEPQQTIQWPAHISFALYKQGMTGIEDTDAWCKRASSKNLRDHGVQDIVGEQERLLGCRLAALGKLTAQEQVNSSAVTLFDLDREVHFESVVQECYLSMALIYPPNKQNK